MKTFLRILAAGGPYTWLLPRYLGATLMNVIFSTIKISTLIPVLQVLFDEDTLKETYEAPTFAWSLGYARDLFYYHFSEYLEVHGRLSALYIICGIVIATFFISNVFGFIASITMNRIRIRVITNLRQKLFGNILQLDLAQFTASRKGDIMARTTTDVQQLETSVVGVFYIFFRDPLFVIGYFVALMLISPELTWYTLAIVPLSAVLISFLTKRMRGSARKSQDVLSTITSLLDETIFGIRIVKSFSAARYAYDRFAEAIHRYGSYDYRIAMSRSLAHPTSEFLGAIFMSLVLIKGGVMVFDGELTGSTFIGFLLLFSQVLNPAKSISKAIGELPRGLAAGHRVFQLMDTEPKIKNVPRANPIKHLEKGFRFENVSFAYEEGSEVLRDVSFEINKGEMVALVGRSGGGKSTIADLLARFYDPSEGTVYLDDTNLKDLAIDDLRSLMGNVTQESILFNDSIFNNIAFGNPQAAEEEVWKAARVANALEFIEKLPEGLHTTIGDRGTKLSGGQRQRLTIARAVFKNPPFLILDEATSSLDSHSEQLVQEAIFNLIRNRTSLIIAHRLSTIQKADRILVVEKGEIVEEGTHQQLIHRGGLYHELTEIQSFD